MTREQHIDRLITAAIAYADMAERCHAHHQHRCNELARAANLARHGQQEEAKQIQKRLDLGACVVFDFTDVQKDLIRAVKPFKKRKP